ncbi:MAG: extracellular solute-binding protein [Treponema sp.]|jgi:multiple sugar transport system substrate-binding protein|nr:extracellular solute-binding protein [Treponema sp.]
MKAKKVLFALLSAALLAGCAGKAGNALRLAWWGNTVRDEQTLKVVDLFTSRNPGVTIDTETVGWGGYWDKLNTQAATKSVPDLIQQDYLYIGQWAGRGQLLDLMPFVDDGTLDISLMPRSVVDSGAIGGKLYGLPVGTTLFCMVYDPAILEKAGIPPIDDEHWTWSDFERIAETIYQKTGVRTVPLGVEDVFPPLENWIQQTGESFYRADGKALGFSDTATLKAFWDLQLRLLDKGVLIPASEAFVQTSLEEDPLSKGRAWIRYIWNSQLSAAAGAAGRPLGLLFAPRLAPERARQPGHFLKPSMFFSIYAQSENPALAAKFLNFFVNDPDANDLLRGERGIPVNAAIRERVAAAADASQQTAFAILSRAASGYAGPVPPPYPPAAGEVNTLLRDLTVQVLNKALSADEAASRFVTRANQVLAGD